MMVAKAKSAKRAGWSGAFVGLLALSACFVVGATLPATAQQIPGIIMSDPEPAIVRPPPAATPPPKAAPRATAPAPRSQKPRPSTSRKPRAAPRKSAAAAGAAGAAAGAAASAKAGQAIVALVNDEPVTGFDVEQRVTFLAMSSGDLGARIQARLKSPDIGERFKSYAMARNPKSQADVDRLRKQFIESIASQARAEIRPKLRKDALEELIEERLKLQAAKKMGIVVGEDDVERVLKTISERNKMTVKQFSDHLRSRGSDVSVMRQRFRASIAWREVARRRFGAMISVNDREIDRAVAGAPGEEANVQLSLQRVVLSVPPGGGQAGFARRFRDAEALRNRFTNCNALPGLVKSIPGSRHESLGFKSASEIAEPTRSILLAARDGQMVPPAVTGGGVELYAVCGRRTQAVSSEKRQQIEAELQEKELGVLGRRLLNDLRQDALIEYR
jgi:peptidyl-prolyl cis-trans isomerase SurA